MNQEAFKHILEHCWRWLFIMMYMHQMALLWGGGFLSGVFSSLRRYQCSCFKLELLNTADTGCSLHSVHIHFTRWHFYRDLNWVFSSCLMNYCLQDAVFRYWLQFTAFTYQQTVEPEREATFEYSFIPNEAFSSRAFGLTVNLNYRDSVSTVRFSRLHTKTAKIIKTVILLGRFDGG